MCMRAEPEAAVPLLFHNGTPSTGQPYHPFVKAAAQRGLRLVSFSRAGTGPRRAIQEQRGGRGAGCGCRARSTGRAALLHVGLGWRRPACVDMCCAAPGSAHRSCHGGRYRSLQRRSIRASSDLSPLRRANAPHYPRRPRRPFGDHWRGRGLVGRGLPGVGSHWVLGLAGR